MRRKKQTKLRYRELYIEQSGDFCASALLSKNLEKSLSVSL